MASGFGDAQGFGPYFNTGDLTIPFHAHEAADVFPEAFFPALAILG
jgi:hypothetical protein